ncbi:MAG TPA: DUF4249 domain-containing protein [Cyclobacteriaceae bacterium]
MKNNFGQIVKYGLFVLVMPLLFSCEDEIFPKLENADPIVVIDAWISNKSGDQVIKITSSQSYFDNTLPPGMSGANVIVTDNLGADFLFVEDTTSPGQYIWSPVGTEVFGDVGNSYVLTVQIGSETYVAVSIMNRVPVIDSISFTFEEESSFLPETYLADFWSSDFVGPNDTYWVKAWKNGIPLNKPGDINLAYDAGFSAGGNFDGVTFITPIRQGINPFDQDENDEIIPPYLPGDSVYVEIHSITLEAFNFMNEVAVQTDRPGGFSELFASPISNVSTNIFNASNSSKKALGFFNVSAVSGLGRRLEQ